MTATQLKTWNVWRSENHRGGRTEHEGTVEADTAEHALQEAQGQFECRKTEHIWVDECQPDEDE